MSEELIITLSTDKPPTEERRTLTLAQMAEWEARAALAEQQRQTEAQRTERITSAIDALRGINFATRRAAIDATNLPASAKTILKALNRTDWLLARALFDIAGDDSSE